MAYGITHYFPGGTKEQYEATLAAVHPGVDRLPEGQTFHAAGPTDGGWLIVAIHDSKESWERFRDGILMPKMQQGVPGGFTTPPPGKSIRRLYAPPLAKRPGRDHCVGTGSVANPPV
jgi:hypothetical protein